MNERARRAADGQHYAVVWLWDALSHGPLFFRTLDDATKKRDEMVRENEKPIPSDYTERQASLMKMCISIERFDGNGWVNVEQGPEIVVGIHYAD